MALIFEPHYEPGQTQAEPDFAALRVPNSQASWREFRVFVDFWRRGDHRKADSVGILSGKFRIKTKLPGRAFLDFIEANKGADIWILNPYPSIAYRSFNVWMQGEHVHPGITVRAQRLLDACGLSWKLESIPRHNHSNLCYCNFWAATAEFWDDYVGGVLNTIAAFLENSPDDPVAQSVMEPTQYAEPLPFLPFIIERLLTTYLSLKPDIKVRAYPTHLNLMEYCKTDLERETILSIRDLIDAADSNHGFTPELVELQDSLGTLVTADILARMTSR